MLNREIFTDQLRENKKAAKGQVHQQNRALPVNKGRTAQGSNNSKGAARGNVERV